MTPEAQRIAIAESLGWKGMDFSTNNITDPKGNKQFYNSCLKSWEDFVPDYLQDLNAMHEAIMLAAEQGGFEFQAVFQLKLQEVIERRRPNLNREQIGWWMNNATASQRAEAFLRVKGLWK